MGACWSKEGRNENIDPKEEKLDGVDPANEKAGKQVHEETPEEIEFKTKVLEIKSDNEKTNVHYILNTLSRVLQKKKVLSLMVLFLMMG